MAADNILAEFLVSLGWKSDDAAQRRMLDSLTAVAVKAKLVGDAIESAVKSTVTALEDMTKSFEDAFYAASRTGSSVKELNAFKYAASQMGSSAEEASSAVEGLSTKMRQSGGANGGYANMLKSLGVTDTTNAVRSAEQLGAIFSRMPITVAESYAQTLGMSENLLLALMKSSEFRDFEEESKRKMKAMGLDPEKAAENGRNLTRIFRSMYASFDALGESIGSKLFTALGPQLKDFTAFLDKNGDRIAAVIVKVADAILKLTSRLVDFLSSDDGQKFIDGLTDPAKWDTFIRQLNAIAEVFEKILGYVKYIGTALSWEKDFEAWVRSLGYGALGFSGLTNIPGSAMGGDGSKPSLLGWAGSKAWSGAKSLWNRATGGGDGGGDMGGNEALARRGHRTANTAALVKAAQDQLIKEGVSPANASAGAAALVGNVIQESRGNPDAVHDGGTGYGLYGAGRDRRDRMLGWLSKNGYARNSAEGQMRYMAIEAMTDPKYARTAAALRRATAGNLGDVTNTVATNFERPAAGPGANYPGRRNNAAAALGAAGKPDAPAVPNWAGTLNPNLMRQQLDRPVAGPTGHVSNDNSISMAPVTNINVSGVSDPNAAAAQVGSTMGRQHSSLLRNLQSAVG